MERLYRNALKEDRVVDAEFYRKSLKSLYPDWEFSLEEQPKQAGAQEKDSEK